MKEDKNMKHVCKLCNKRYPCGRSLGGHMRSHIITNSAEAEEETKPNIEKVSSSGGNSKKKSGAEANEYSAYGLRQNPKKTWRFVGSSSGMQQQENVCKECGKGFQSLKALCGHMACHSQKEKVSNSLEYNSWTSGNQQLVMDSQSVSSSSLSLANVSSSVSEIEQEQEEVAMCLMMLSRDSGNWGGLNSVAESSINNSVVLEARSLSIDMRIAKKKGVNCVYNGGETVDMKKEGCKKMKSGVFYAEIVHFENSDSGYFRNGAKKVESDVSIVGIMRNDKFKRLKVENGSGFEVFDAGLGKGMKRLKCTKTEFVKNLVKEEGFGHGQADEALMRCDSRKRVKNDSYSPELWGFSCKKTEHGSANVELCKNAQKRSKFDFFDSAYRSGENSIGSDTATDPMLDSKLIDFCSGKNLSDQDSSGNPKKRSPSKKSEGHECPICFRVFRSGQALGGHKRSHLVGGSEDKSKQSTPVVKQEPSEIPNLLDLNLPAPIEDEANGHASFMP